MVRRRKADKACAAVSVTDRFVSVRYGEADTVCLGRAGRGRMRHVEVRKGEADKARRGRRRPFRVRCGAARSGKADNDRIGDARHGAPSIGKLAQVVADEDWRDTVVRGGAR